MGACVQSKDFDYCNLESIDTCSHIASLIFLVNQYISDSFKITCDYKDIDILRVLNDYLHVMEHHADDQQFEEIVQSFPICDIYKCDAFRRNNRNRNISNNDDHEQKQDEHETSIIDIFDKIHCCFCHCYDVGNRLTTQEKDDMMMGDDAESKDDDPFTEQLVKKRVKAIHSLLCRKRKHYENIYNDLNINKRVKGKFNQLVETNENDKNTKTYSFGYKFEYDPYDIKDDGPEIERNYVSAKYADLKEEITNNPIATLTVHQYHNEYRKAEIHFNSLHNKTKFKDIGIYRESESDNYMPLECILSLMIYCNYDVLQYEFSKTYREENAAKHANFYFLGKYMKHAFSKYRVSNDFESKNHTNISTFYHGISETMVLPAYVSVLINSPLSTSSSLEVAINFTNDNDGLVIGFGLINGGALSVSWLSDYANEREYLFIQNDWTLSIEDILDPTIGYQYGMVLKSLNWIHEIVSVEGDARYMKLEPEILSLMAAIIEHQLSLVEYLADEYTTMKSLGVYGQEICNVYFQNQTEIGLSVSLRNDNPDLNVILRLLFHSNCDWINLKVIFALFPNLQEVTVPAGDVHLTPEIFDTMLVYLMARRKLNIFTPKLVTIGAKQQEVVSLVDKYSDLFLQYGGFLLYDHEHGAHFLPEIDPVWLRLQICDEIEFVYNWILSNLGHNRVTKLGQDGVYFKDTNQAIAKLVDNLIKIQLSERNIKDTSVDETQLKLFNDHCIATKNIHIHWKRLCSDSKLYFFETFCDEKNKWIKLETVNQLFPNLDTLDVNGINLTVFVLENIVNHLKKSKTKLKWITLRANKNSDVTPTQAMKDYQKSFNDVGFKLYDEATYDGNAVAEEYEYEYSEDEPKTFMVYIKRLD